MKIILILATCAMVNAGLDRQKRWIIDGQDADIEDYPFYVNLRIQNRFFCGGTLLNNRWVLTAAHCVENWREATYFGDLLAYFGTSKRDPEGEPDAVSRRASKVIIHRDWVDAETFKKTLVGVDLALIELQKPIDKTTKKIQYARLPNSNDNLKIGDKLYLVGNGYTGWTRSDKITIADQLQKATSKLVDCGGVTPKYNMICSGADNDVGVCRGDSGSPVTAMDSSGQKYLVGVVSVGGSTHEIEQCGHGGFEAHFNVSHYLDWIKETMSQNSGGEIDETPDEVPESNPDGPQYPDYNNNEDQDENQYNNPHDYYDVNNKHKACKNHVEPAGCQAYKDLAIECSELGWIREHRCLKICGWC